MSYENLESEIDASIKNARRTLYVMMAVYGAVGALAVGAAGVLVWALVRLVLKYT